MTDKTPEERERIAKENALSLERYNAACHAMQSGVAVELGIDGTSGTPKHLRTGVNSAMVNNQAMVELLIEKGVITHKEFFDKLADCMEAEAKAYEKRLSDHAGVNIKLG